VRGAAPPVAGAPGGFVPSTSPSSLLSFAQQPAFEEWLKHCPLDAHSLTYGVSRKDAATHCVELQWKVPLPAAVREGQPWVWTATEGAVEALSPAPR
jgi:hypothetical protein